MQEAPKLGECGQTAYLIFIVTGFKRNIQWCIICIEMNIETVFLKQCVSGR